VIVRLAGRLIEKHPDHVVLDVGGVGYQLWITLNCYTALPDVGAELTLKTYHQVREDGQELFGFASDEERELFRHLISISGIGAKSAIGILSGALPEDLRRRVADGDEDALTAIRGVGPKMARRIITELRDTFGLDSTDWDTAVTAGGHTLDVASQAAQSLISLGYRQNEARQAVRAALKKVPPESPVETVIRAALGGHG
jgi:Holliday junction DNA helicase RuvA